MSRIDPTFLSILYPLGLRPMDRIPERPLQPPHDLHAPLPFDEYDDECIKQIVPERLCKAVQELLLTRKAIQNTDGSFGVDNGRLSSEIRKDLDRLHEACIDAWRDL